MCIESIRRYRRRCMPRRARRKSLVWLDRELDRFDDTLSRSDTINRQIDATQIGRDVVTAKRR